MCVCIHECMTNHNSLSALRYSVTWPQFTDQPWDTILSSVCFRNAKSQQLCCGYWELGQWNVMNTFKKTTLVFQQVFMQNNYPTQIRRLMVVISLTSAFLFSLYKHANICKHLW